MHPIIPYIVVGFLYLCQLLWLIAEINKMGCERSIETKREALLCLIPIFPIVHSIVENFKRLE